MHPDKPNKTGLLTAIWMASIVTVLASCAMVIVADLNGWDKVTIVAYVMGVISSIATLITGVKVAIRDAQDR